MRVHSYSEPFRFMTKLNNLVQKTSSPQTSNVTTQFGNSFSSFIKKLIRAKMTERRLKGLCYNCNELFVVTHQCKCLFYLEIECNTGPEQQEKTGESTTFTFQV